VTMRSFAHVRDLLRHYWPHIGNGLIVLMSVVWYVLERTTEAAAMICISAVIFVCATGYAVAVRRRRDRAAIFFNWADGIGGCLAFGIASPHFLPIALLCALEGALTAFSLAGNGQRQLRAYNVTAIAAVVLIIIVAESTRTGHLQMSLQFTPQQIVVYQTIYLIGFSMTIGRHVLHFFSTMESTINRLTRSNRQLRAAEHELQERLVERSRLLEISRVVGSTQTLDALLHSVLAQMQTVVDFDRAAVLLLQNDELILTVDAGRIHPDQMLSPQFIHRPQYYDPLIRRSQPLLVPDLQKELPDERFHGAWLGVPLVVRGRNIGLLTLRHMQANFFRPRHTELCVAFANQVAGLIDSARLQDSAAHAVVVAERHRLARELHDSVSQSLFGIVLGVRTALEQVERLPDSAREAIDYSIRLADSALAEMRALIFTLRPEILERKGLVAALQNQIELFLPLQQSRIIFTAPESEPHCSPQVKEALYRIASEAFRNATRHSNCRTIEIRITTSPTLCIEVVDDGRGFDPTAEYVNHLGLKSMRERAEAIGGLLTIDSAPDRGTRISITIPTTA
jgi:signal transduction histidine kinase